MPQTDTLATLSKREVLFQNVSTQVERAHSELYGSVIVKQCLLGASDAQKSRFLFSAELLQKFDHPNIVPVLEVSAGQNLPYLILDDNDSIDLRVYAASFDDQQLPIETFLRIAIQLVDALGVIHHAQVIHKDLHPGNIVIQPKTLDVRIIDFGLASLLSREQPVLAAPEHLEGVLAYLSPEQTGRMNRVVDYRTDFYTLGVTFYQMLTGQLPFKAEDALGLIYAHMAVNQRPVKELRVDVPEVLSDLIDKLLNKNAEDRYQSALGIKHDLEACLEAFRDLKNLESYQLGIKDISDRFCIPQTLYGREREVGKLLNKFKQASQGTPQLLAIAGYSGIGKSALVHEIHKPIAECHGLFISGKFDQFQQNTPYYALKQALKVWLTQALRLPKEQLRTLKEQLLNDIGVNARVMIDFMPEFEPLLGELEPVPVLGAQETQVRFHLVFQSFISCATQTQPWVMFIDDLQWADRGTLNLLPELLSESNGRFLVIVAYRDNEVNPLHPAMQMLTSLTHDLITLEALPESQVSRLLQDTLSCSDAEVEPLAELIHRKTGGNPFFTVEFLKTLYSKQLLDFDLDARCWQWDIAAIEHEDITNNVVELMLQKMKALPEDTQALLQLAACVGTQFDLHTLAIISNRGDDRNGVIEVANILWPALKEGLLLQAGGDWFLGLTEQEYSQTSENLSSSLGQGVWIRECKFLHDRMLQAAYESLDESVRVQTHLNIGRLLHGFASEQERQDQVFEIVEQLNHGIHLIADPKERLELAKLNLIASKKAKLASVWDSTLSFAEKGLSLLPDNSWQAHYELIKGLYWSATDSSFLVGQHDKSEILCEQLLASLTDPVDKAALYAERIILYVGSAQFHKAVESGIKGLSLLGIPFPTEPDAQDAFVVEQYQRVVNKLSETPLEIFSQLPLLDDRPTEIVMSILVNLGLVGVIVKNIRLLKLCAHESIIVSATKGKCEYTGSAVAMYGVACCFSDRLNEAQKCGQQALILHDQYPMVQASSSLLNVVGVSLHHLNGSWSECIELHKQGIEVGLATGELARSGINYSNICQIQLNQGRALSEVERTLNDCIEFCEPKRISPLYLVVCKPFVYSMLSGDYQLSDEHFTEQQRQVLKHSFFGAALKLFRLMFHFWSNRPVAELLTLVEDIEQDIVDIKLFPQSYDLYILGYLVIVEARLQGDLLDDSVWLSRLENYHAKLAQYAALNPENHLHKFLLVKAENARLDNKPMDEVCLLYKQAIEDAFSNGFRQYHALANERFGRYLLSKGLPELAQPVIEKAYKGYKDWQGKPKLVSLVAEFPFLAPIERITSASYGAVSSMDAASESWQMADVSSAPASNSKSSLVGQLDYLSLIKGSQAISSQLALEGLVAEVMTVLMENAGAQLGAIIFRDESELYVEAQVDSELGRSEYLQHQLLNQAWLPISLIDLCLRTENLVKLDDASETMNGYHDSYLMEVQPKSVLCMPIKYRDQIIGVLYLENRISKSAFTEHRLDTLSMLLAQAAISLENARLFEQVNELNTNLEHKVEERTAELKATQAQLVEAEKMASLGELVRGVAHELNTPLGTAVTAASIVNSLTEELECKFKEKALSAGFIRDYLANIQNSGALLTSAINRTNRLVDTFKSISVDEVVDTIQGFSLNETLALVSSQATASLGEAGHRFLFSCENGLRMHSYQQVLVEVVLKLIENAKLHAFEGVESGSGLVSVTAVSAADNVNRVIIDVRDNGLGMSSELVKKIFDPFTTSKRGARENIGLGMHVVYNLVTRKLAGTIECQSEEGEGTGFVMSLPKVIPS